MSGAASTAWLRAAIELLERIEREQPEPMEQASRICADAIAAGGLVHLFGTGHSRIPVEEMFPRYGSYPGFHPIVELSMTFHTQVVGANGQRQAMFVERVSGLAEAILANFEIGPPDAMMIFSVGGRGAVSVEMAQAARARGLEVIAATSLAETMAGAPASPGATRLRDHATVLLDLATPPGDALIDVPGWDARVGPGSTVTAVAFVNCIKVRTAQLLAERGVDLPVISSASLVGRERSERSFDAAYAEHARRAARALRTNPAGS